MPIIEPVIRPPAEADSFLLQVTTGCTSNCCTYCGAYMDKPFRMKDLAEIIADIKEEKRLNPETRRVFLMDGDALAVNNSKILPIMDVLNNSFPKLNRIASYANGYNITGRSDQELQQLYDHKLRLLYIGLESGSQTILDRCRKRATVAEMIEAVRRAEQAGIKSSVIVLLGLGGRRDSRLHVRETITALNQMQPRYLSFLSLMLIPGTPLYQDAKTGGFEELNSVELLEETQGIIAGLELERTIFRCDHASNYLPLEGRFPADKEKLLIILDEALQGRVHLRPEFMRGL
jgi:radical SAM superfamily enzyme YgiQ (UPF0313 family)